MKEGISTDDVLELAEIQMKVYGLTVGSFMNDITYNHKNDLDLTDEDLDVIESALIRKALVENYDNADILDLIIDHSYDFKYAINNKDAYLTSGLLGNVKTSNVYKAIRDIISTGGNGK